jgi:hypothetical protein
MERKNEFYGAVISSSVISDYYPGNFDFSHFVFQQKVKDGSKKDDEYLLNVYAVGINGMVMNNGETLELKDKQADPSLKAKEKVEFANSKLNLTLLQQLYPQGAPVTDLKVYPSGFYLETGYIVYEAKPEPTGDTTTVPVVKLNPSPPA